MSECRIIIAGSRDFYNYSIVKHHMHEIFANRNIKKEDVRIISGTANGADKFGEQYAEEYGLKLSCFPADWDNLGKRAGYIRNETMAKFTIEDGNRGILVAFWDGKSKGTKHMIDLAEKYKLEVHTVYF